MISEMYTLFTIALDRDAKLTIYTVIGLIGLLLYLVGLMLIIQTNPVENAGQKTVWTCRLQPQAERDGFEMLEEQDVV